MRLSRGSIGRHLLEASRTGPDRNFLTTSLPIVSFRNPACSATRGGVRVGKALGDCDVSVEEVTVCVSGSGGEEKRQVFCASEGGEEFIVIELKHCSRGRPLMPEAGGLAPPAESRSH